MLLALGVPFLIFIAGVFLTERLSGGVVFGIIALVICCTASCEETPHTEENAVRETVNIQSAATGSTVHGNFVLGSGTVGGKRYYAYWTSEGTHAEGAVERRTVTEEDYDVEIVEGESNPRIVFTEYKAPGPKLWTTYLVSHYKRATIYVPEGSIRYNFDLKATNK